MTKKQIFDLIEAAVLSQMETLNQDGLSMEERNSINGRIEALNACQRALKNNATKLKSYIVGELPESLKGEKPAKLPLLTDADEIGRVLQRIDIEEFQRRYPSVPVDEVFNDFYDKCTQGTATKPSPNPYHYRDWNLAFHEWCKRSERENRGRPSPKKNLKWVK